MIVLGLRRVTPEPPIVLGQIFLLQKPVGLLMGLDLFQPRFGRATGSRHPGPPLPYCDEGELRQDIQYYHRLCLLTIVSSGFPIPLGIRFQRNGETEVACSLALLQQLVERLGRRFLDVLVADAIYLQTPFVSALEALGLSWVITLKENQPDLLAEAQRVTLSQAPCPLAAGQSDELQLWYAPRLDWPVADRDIHVVKTLRRHPRNRQPVQRDSTEPKRIVKATVIEQSTNFYASNLELGSIPPLFLSQLGRSRWQIDADVFQTITTDSSLKQPSLHQGYEKALLVLTMIRVLAFTLTQVFYYRQVRSHFRQPGFSFRDLARRIGYQFLVPSSSFDST